MTSQSKDHIQAAVNYRSAYNLRSATTLQAAGQAWAVDAAAHFAFMRFLCLSSQRLTDGGLDELWRGALPKEKDRLSSVFP